MLKKIWKVYNKTMDAIALTIGVICLIPFLLVFGVSYCGFYLGMTFVDLTIKFFLTNWFELLIEALFKLIAFSIKVFKLGGAILLGFVVGIPLMILSPFLFLPIALLAIPLVLCQEAPAVASSIKDETVNLVKKIIRGVTHA